MYTIPTVETDQLTLRPLEPADADVWHRICGTEVLFDQLPSTDPQRLKKVQQFVVDEQEHWDQYGYGIWGIVLKGEPQMIGMVGLQLSYDDNETEVVYLFDEDYWREDYAAEAVGAAIQFGFEHAVLNYIIALANSENMERRRVFEACGMFYEQELPWVIEVVRYRINRNR